MKTGILIVIVITLFIPLSANAQDGFIPITAQNINDLEPGYALPGPCGVVTPDDHLMAVRGYGVYDLFSGQQLFEIGRGKQAISPDGQYLAVMNDGVYEIATGGKLFEITGVDDQYHDGPRFSPDGQYLAVVGDHLYRVPSGEQIRVIQERERKAYEFSPDSSLIAMTGQGVYETATGELRFPIGGFTFGDEHLKFSPDGNYLAVTIDGIYDVEAGKRLVEMSAAADFSPDSSKVAVGLDGVYTLDPFEKVMDLSNYYTAIFDPTGTRIIIEYRGIDKDGIQHVYDLTTQQELFSVEGYGPPEYSPDGQWLFEDGSIYDAEEGVVSYEYYASPDGVIPFHPSAPLYASYLGIIDLTRQEDVPVETYAAQNISFTPAGIFVVSDIYTFTVRRCMIYGIAGDPWPMRYGILYANHSINLRDAPNGYAFDSASGTLIVQGYTTLFDKDWYQVGDDAWVASWVVDVEYLPEALAYVTN